LSSHPNVFGILTRPPATSSVAPSTCTFLQIPHEPAAALTRCETFYVTFSHLPLQDIYPTISFPKMKKKKHIGHGHDMTA
jgi:hypothetical protein